MSGHVLICQYCGRTFTTKRSDAIGCSRSCRRHLEKAARAAVAPSPLESALSSKPLVEDAELDEGWRRVGRYVIPPPDPRLTVLADPDALRRR